MYQIGFMQGRLSEVVDGKIQAFPWRGWQEEFRQAREIGIGLMEWTLDHFDLYKNPFMTREGQKEIIRLSKEHDLKIPSLTGDCFMQAPFWKTASDNRKNLIDDFIEVVSACGFLNVKTVVVPLVDNGSLTTEREEGYLIDILAEHETLLAKNEVKIAFESDFSPIALEHFIGKLDPAFYGVNYDIGNSAALGFSVNDEFARYGGRILNVHIKDRLLGGTTVPLGEGNAEFNAVFAKLFECDYSGNYILQTARDASGQHIEAIKHYLDMTINWIAEHES